LFISSFYFIIFCNFFCHVLILTFAALFVYYVVQCDIFLSALLCQSEKPGFTCTQNRKPYLITSLEGAHSHHCNQW
jgi:hypothetical protein